jgi:hypothetical protein
MKQDNVGEKKDNFEVTRFSRLSNDAIETLKQNLPNKYSVALTDEIYSLIDKMKEENSMNDSDAVSSILENFTFVKDIKGLTFDRYCVALRFVSLVLNGVTQIDAWKIIFPEKTKRGYSQEQMLKWSTAYANTKLVSTLKARMMVSFSIQYSHFRHAAIQKEYDLMMGIPSVCKIPKYKRTKDGKIKLDKDGQKQILRTKHGNIMYEEVYQVVTPMVQHQAAQTILEITKPKEESEIDINVAISVDETNEKMKIKRTMMEIAQAQRERLERGESIDDVQRIGDIIETSLVDDKEDEDE